MGLESRIAALHAVQVGRHCPVKLTARDCWAWAAGCVPTSARQLHTADGGPGKGQTRQQPPASPACRACCASHRASQCLRCICLGRSTLAPVDLIDSTRSAPLPSIYRCLMGSTRAGLRARQSCHGSRTHIGAVVSRVFLTRYACHVIQPAGKHPTIKVEGAAAARCSVPARHAIVPPAALLMSMSPTLLLLA